MKCIGLPCKVYATAMRMAPDMHISSVCILLLGKACISIRLMHKPWLKYGTALEWSTRNNSAHGQHQLSHACLLLNLQRFGAFGMGAGFPGQKDLPPLALPEAAAAAAAAAGLMPASILGMRKTMSRLHDKYVETCM
jgi:hypothetical protein